MAWQCKEFILHLCRDCVPTLETKKRMGSVIVMIVYVPQTLFHSTRLVFIK